MRGFWPQIFELAPPGMYVYDSHVGYVLSPGFRGTISRSEFRVPFTTNRAGLRGVDPGSSHASTYRILLLGDSMIWGFGVEDDQTVSARLQDLLRARYSKPTVEVLNAGVPGYGTADELAFLKARGAELEPDLVVVQFFPVNDFEEYRTPARTWAAESDGKLVRRDSAHASASKVGPAWKAWREWLKQHSHVARLSFDGVGYIATRVGLLERVDAMWGEDFTEEDAARGVALLVEVAEVARSLGARTLYLYTTGQAQVIQDQYRPARSLMIVRDAARISGAPWVDVSQHLQKRPDRLELYYPLDGHWTARGNEAVSEILLEAILNEK